MPNYRLVKQNQEYFLFNNWENRTGKVIIARIKKGRCYLFKTDDRKLRNCQVRFIFLNIQDEIRSPHSTHGWSATVTPEPVFERVAHWNNG